MKLLQPYIARGRVAEWYRGTADAVLQNFNVIEHDAGDIILILAGDHIYKMDYQPFIAAHRRKRADVTIAVRRVPLAEATRMGILALDENDRVTEWQEKPKQPEERPRLDGRLRLLEAGAPALAQRGPHRLRPRRRSRRCSRAVPASSATTSTATGRTSARSRRYWEANLALLEDQPELDLYDRDWLIHTRSEERAPAQVGPTAQVHRSLISHGCVINGTVVNSVLSPGVRVDVGAVVRDSIVMFDSVIRSGRGRRPLDPRQGGRRRAGRDRRRRAGLRHAEPPGAGPPQHRDHGHRQAGDHPARRPDRAQREGRRRREVDRLRVAGS